MSYSSLHVHSDYSNIRMLDSINQLPLLFDRAKELGLTGMAITDHESLSGHIKAMQLLSSLREKAKTEEDKKYWNDFKLILGNEIYLTRNDLTKDNYIKGQDKYFHFILLAKDEEGHKQLRELSSRAWSHSFRQFIERVPTYYRDIEEIIGANPGHVIGSTACLGSKFANLIREYLDNNHSKEIVKRIDNFVQWCQTQFGKDNFYIELQSSESDDQNIYNECALAYAKARGLKVIITTDAHYIKKEDRPLHKAYLNAGEGDRETDAFYSGTYLQSVEDIKGYMTNINESDIDWMLNNTNEIANKIEEYSLYHKEIVPKIKLEKEFTYCLAIHELARKREYIAKFMNSESEQDKYYINGILNGLEKKIDQSKWEQYIDQINKEVAEVWEITQKIGNDLSSYFNTMAKVVDIMWNEGDSLVGISRGSAGGFVSNYLLGITQMDPIKYGIENMYWRFIHRDRPELPDVDTDFQASKRPRVTAALKQYFESIGGEVYNIATFGTETAKAALQTAARGLGYDSDLGVYISSLVPIDRGKVRTLQQCYYGDEEKDFAPIPQFVNTMNQYQDIWEVAQKVEGTICRRGLHACGMLIVNEDFCEHNAVMKAPNGTLCSQFELHDSEYMGGVKFDALTTDALDRIRTCLDLLLKYGYIEWENSLKETYNKYIGLENLDYDTQEMWQEIGENKISNLFQYDTPVGLATAKLVKPENTMELAIANSLMRLMADESGIMPSETFTRYKNNIDLWYNEMRRYGLTDEEIKIMEKHLLANSGVCESQEGIMLISMDENISGFSVKEANKLRKTIAKKKLAEIDSMHEMFMKKGREQGTSDNLLNYVWNVQVKRQLGYSFSVLHSFGYSLIAVQEMNLAYHYPTIFWNCANLIVDSAGIDENDEFINLIDDFDPATESAEETEEEDNDDEEEMTKEEKEEVKKQNKTVNYGKIASAIGKMMALGISVELPDINKSEFTFTPDLETNSIIFGIKGINRINNDLAKAIIDNRPFNSLQDFLNRVKTNKVSTINLIKSGCFDKVENKPREEIMREYIDQISDKKQKLTLQNMAMLIRENCVPEEFKTEVHIYNFNKYLKNFKKEIYYMFDERAFNFYEKMFDMDLVSQDEEGTFRIKQTEWDKIYKRQMTGIKEELKANPSILENLNKKLFDAMWNKYAEGTISKWEMDSVCFYHHPHELAIIDKDRYLIENYTSLPEEPVIDKIWTTKDGKEIPIFKLTRICGTVIDKNKTKNIVTLLTDDGVVNLKIYRAQFSKYDKQISVKDEITGKKTIVERSWFKRGNKLMVVGIRRGDNFVPKMYKNNPYFTYPIELITNIDENGNVDVAGDRAE
ncbi:MAG: DNA polymerase III subunit alpha [Alphaproteobacteria bacterium]|nr:DNA polymerase III subunit alpha [Alphaproteobacteria bacterium]